eukprot:Hpha_TRINITY_DN18383_c0_g1::TRINITY_DN18383_c0_g1_i1::g.158281::m.158281
MKDNIVFITVLASLSLFWGQAAAECNVTPETVIKEVDEEELGLDIPQVPTTCKDHSTAQGVVNCTFINPISSGSLETLYNNINSSLVKRLACPTLRVEYSEPGYKPPGLSFFVWDSSTVVFPPPEPTVQPSAPPSTPPVVLPTLNPTHSPSQPSVPPPTGPPLSPTAPPSKRPTRSPIEDFKRSPLLGLCCPEGQSTCEFEPIAGLDQSTELGNLLGAPSQWGVECNSGTQYCDLPEEQAWVECLKWDKCCGVMEIGTNHTANSFYRLGICPTKVKTDHGLDIEYHVCQRRFSPRLSFCFESDWGGTYSTTNAGPGFLPTVQYPGSCAEGTLRGTDKQECWMPWRKAMEVCGSDNDCCSLTDDTSHAEELQLGGCGDLDSIPAGAHLFGTCLRSRSPTSAPSFGPTSHPSMSPTSSPSLAPVLPPTLQPSLTPTEFGVTFPPTETYFRSPALQQCCPRGETDCGWEYVEGFDEATRLGDNQTLWPFDCPGVSPNATDCQLSDTIAFQVCEQSENCCGVMETGLTHTNETSNYFLAKCPTNVEFSGGGMAHVCRRMFSPLRGFCQNAKSAQYTSNPGGRGTYTHIAYNGTCPVNDTDDKCIVNASDGLAFCSKDPKCCSLTEETGRPGKVTIGGCEGFPDYTKVAGPLIATVGSCSKFGATTVPPTANPSAPPTIPPTQKPSIPPSVFIPPTASPSTPPTSSPVVAGTCSSYFYDGQICPDGTRLIDEAGTVNCGGGSEPSTCTSKDNFRCCRLPYTCYAVNEGELVPCAGAFIFGGEVQFGCASDAQEKNGGFSWDSTTLVPSVALMKAQKDLNLTECGPRSECSWCLTNRQRLESSYGECRCIHTPAPPTPAPETPVPDTPAPDTPVPATEAPTLSPAVPSVSPSHHPRGPSMSPIPAPTGHPSATPTASPQTPSASPTTAPTAAPSPVPTPTATETMPADNEIDYDALSWVWALIIILALIPCGAWWKRYSAGRRRELRREMFGEWTIEDLLPTVQDSIEMENAYLQCQHCNFYSPGSAAHCSKCHEPLQRSHIKPLCNEERTLMSTRGGFNVWKSALFAREP